MEGLLDAIARELNPGLPYNPDGTTKAHGNIRADGTFIGPDGRVWGSDAGEAAVASMALANEQRPEMVNLGLIQVGSPSSGVTSDFSPDWQAPTNFNPADVPPPWVPDPAVYGDESNLWNGAGAPPDNPRGTHAQTPGMLGGGNFLLDTMGSYYGIGPGDQGWSRDMAAPRYYIWNSPAGPRIIDRTQRDNWTEWMKDNLGFRGGGNAAQLGWPQGFQTWGGYTVLAAPGDIGGFVGRGYEAGSAG